MSNVLIIAEHFDGKLNGATAKCVAAAQALGPAAIDIAVLADAPAAVAAEAAHAAPAAIAEPAACSCIESHIAPITAR